MPEDVIQGLWLSRHVSKRVSHAAPIAYRGRHSSSHVNSHGQWYLSQPAFAFAKAATGRKDSIFNDAVLPGSTRHRRRRRHGRPQIRPAKPTARDRFRLARHRAPLRGGVRLEALVRGVRSRTAVGSLVFAHEGSLDEVRSGHLGPRAAAPPTLECYSVHGPAAPLGFDGIIWIAVAVCAVAGISGRLGR